jgi:glycosyltransferase involved in cell wall biosynthesis
MTGLRIGIDAHQLGRQQTGNERVMANVISELGRLTDHEIVLYFTNRDVSREWASVQNGRFTCKTLAASSAFVRIPALLPAAAFRDRLDVLLCHMVAPPIRSCPVVTLVHDISFRRHPEFFSLYERCFMNCAVPLSMRWSNAVVAVSNFTRDEVLEVYGLSPSKVFVAQNGVDRNLFSDSVGSQRASSPPYFLAVGNLQPRKNLSTLIAAYTALIRRRPEILERLMIVGQPAYKASVVLDAASDLVEQGRIVFTGFVDDDALLTLLRGATAFAYPSVYEGFGLPPLEAMAVGTPTMVADIPVMREVVGDAGVLVPARGVDAWAGALEMLATQAEVGERLSEAGTERAARFTWERSAKAIISAISSVAGGTSSLPTSCGGKA